MVTAKELKKWAEEHSFYIHPKRDPEQWAEMVNEKYNGGCACDPKREKCPCVESIEEVHNGERYACRCTLFVSKSYLDKWGYDLEEKPKPRKKIKRKKPMAEATED